MPPPELEVGEARRTQATERRKNAVDLRAADPLLASINNGDEDAFDDGYPASFTKGLKHDNEGLVDPDTYKAFRAALVQPQHNMGGLPIAGAAGQNSRKWESPLAGHYFTVQGPDPDAVSMPPAPKLGRSELCAEMAAVYAMALTRDLTFAELEDPSTKIKNISHPDGSHVTVGDIVAELGKLSWNDHDKKPVGYGGGDLKGHEVRRRDASLDSGKMTIDVLFRGSTPGAKNGAYVSQFMLLGTPNRNAASPLVATDGKITYGTQTIDQRSESAAAEENFMTSWSDWLHVQNGVRPSKKERVTTSRFITTPRDLATYVHHDQLYQAYFNACLMLLGSQLAPDTGTPIINSRNDNSEGFATWGGPHILSLVTEVATRALRAVRRQKFQVHRRARPEVIAARLTQVANGHTGKMKPGTIKQLQSMLDELGADDPTDTDRPGMLMQWVAQLNEATGQPLGLDDLLDNPIDAGQNYLLPMAFTEGSPMHPAYGAGHATVAGSCVTVLKAFFDGDAKLKATLHHDDKQNPIGHLFAPDAHGTLKHTHAEYDPSVSDELDKLAANIAIGRNMAGVHYYSDYYDSLRMGERIAVGIIEEQMLTYDEPVSLTFKSFDGETVTVKTDGAGTKEGVETIIIGKDGPMDRNAWWVKDLAEYGIPVAAAGT